MKSQLEYKANQLNHVAEQKLNKKPNYKVSTHVNISFPSKVFM